MKTSEYFHERVAVYLSYLSDTALNAGIDVVRTIIALGTAMPYTAWDYQNALAAWLQGRYNVWQSYIGDYEANPTDEKLKDIARLALGEHTPHTQQDYDDIVESAYRLSVDEELIENEIQKRRNNGK